MKGCGCTELVRLDSVNTKQDMPWCYQCLRIPIRMFLGHPDPSVRLRILISSSKNSKKNLDSHCFVTFFDFLPLKNNVNVASKSNKEKIIFTCHLECHRWKKQDPNPYPLLEVRIRKTGCYLRLRGAGIVSERHGVASNVVEALVTEGILVVEQTGCRIPEFKNNNKNQLSKQQEHKRQKKILGAFKH